jgi:Arm DNA-binding domain
VLQAFLAFFRLKVFHRSTLYLTQNDAPVKIFCCCYLQKPAYQQEDFIMARKLLTDRKIQSLKAAPKGKRVQIMDAKVPGSGVRVTDNGARTYIFQARFPGSKFPTRREIDRVEAITLEKARKTAERWSDLVKQGRDPAVVDKQAKEALAAEQAKTFGGIMADYFAMKLAGQRSGKAIRKRIEKHQLPVFKDTPIAEITDLDILAKVVNPRRVETPAMARSLFNDLGGFFSWVIDQRVYGLKISPCATIKISKIVGKISPVSAS